MKIIRGVWQLSEGHLKENANYNPIDPILDAIDNDFLIYDCADIYTGTEILLGVARQKAFENGKQIKIHTKFVPNLADLDSIDLKYVERSIDRSLTRLKMESLDLVQFHWWDYNIPYYLNTLEYLSQLKERGKIKAIGLTNFSTSKVKEIISEGFDIASIQVQYSFLDRRMEALLLPFCQSHNIKILTYGSLLGGFISEAWCNMPEPAFENLANRSLIKYKLIIDDWGGWDKFQRFLFLLIKLSEKYKCSIAQLVISTLIQTKKTDSIIVGLSSKNYKAQNLALTKLSLLENEDIENILSWSSDIKGDIYDLERSHVNHKNIMRYNQNTFS